MERQGAAYLIAAFSVVLSTSVVAERYTPVSLCAITSDNNYESITLPLGFGGDYPSGGVQVITTVIGDSKQPSNGGGECG